jgi:hypothetical protein
VPVSNVGKNLKVRSLPHLAKNERDMGHPTILGRKRKPRRPAVALPEAKTYS